MSVNNIDKLMWYLRLVAKEPIHVDNKVYWVEKTEIRLQKTFFHTDSCISCGCCCVVEDNVYTQHEYDKIMSITDAEFNSAHPDLDPANLHRLRKGIKQVNHIVNGITKPFYIYKKEPTTYFVPNKGETGKIVERCTWQTHQGEKFYCGIHPVESITCALPHMKWFYVNRTHTISIGTSQYGRNWALGCPIQFYPPANEEQFNEIKEARLDKFRHLNRNAEDLEIETWLPDMIRYTEGIPFDGYQRYLEKNIISELKDNKHLFTYNQP